MVAGLGAAPGGSPQWLLIAFGLGSLLIGMFGRGFVASALAAMRNRKAGLAAREGEARAQERVYRAEERTAAEVATEQAFARMGQQLQDADSRISELSREVHQLRAEVRAQFVREQQTMTTLSAHAVWDLATQTHLPDDFPHPPPLMPPREQVHAAEWGPAPG